ncbi:hypothetical protein T4A_11033 [Trichinella pseudospiralis]|uniref:Uncharacterized protein n=1 Tax=Trichinella pseudospiralis TaxID=6337 RepID=A0A0V1CDZ9_TRIPS|nr:hypothetical protein T4A_11033 [Trichinella pseudospiralis]
MLTHSEDDSFLQISQEIGDKERCGYFHCIWQIFSSKISKFRDLVVLRKPAKYFFHNLNFF